MVDIFSEYQVSSEQFSHAHTHVSTHTHIPHTHVSTHAHTTHTCTRHIHTYTHTNTHTHTHTHTFMGMNRLHSIIFHPFFIKPDLGFNLVNRVDH